MVLRPLDLSIGCFVLDLSFSLQGPYLNVVVCNMWVLVVVFVAVLLLLVC